MSIMLSKPVNLVACPHCFFEYDHDLKQYFYKYLKCSHNFKGDIYRLIMQNTELCRENARVTSTKINLTIEYQIKLRKGTRPNLVPTKF